MELRKKKEELLNTDNDAWVLFVLFKVFQWDK